MWTYFEFLFFLAAAFQAGHCLNANRLPNAVTVPLNEANVIGGDLATHGEFPYQVSIQHKGLFGQQHICGGSIVTEKHVITAAHCIENIGTSSIVVIAGMTSLTDDVDTKQEIKASAKYIHENYLSSTKDNDIALIKLSEDLVLNDFVSVIQIPSEEVSYGSSCTVTGWGVIQESGDMVQELHKVDIPLVESFLCRTFYGESAISDGMLCAGKIVGGVGACSGDEGGPLQCEGNLHGIASWSKGCADAAYPGVYTKVTHYKEWIDLFISNL